MIVDNQGKSEGLFEYDETKPQRSFYDEDKSITLHISISYNTELSKYRKSFVARSCQSFARFKKMLQFFFAAVSEQAFSWFHHAIITQWLAHMIDAEKKCSIFIFTFEKQFLDKEGTCSDFISAV